VLQKNAKTPLHDSVLKIVRTLEKTDPKNSRVHIWTRKKSNMAHPKQECLECPAPFKLAVNYSRTLRLNHQPLLTWKFQEDDCSRDTLPYHFIQMSAASVGGPPVRRTLFAPQFLAPCRQQHRKMTHLDHFNFILPGDLRFPFVICI